MAGLQVLHVDDEPDMRLLVKLSLDLDASINTRSAATGEEALDVTAQWQPDVILLDAAMPGMDGLATLRALQSNPKTAGIPVVFLTARCDAADIDAFAAVGSAGVIAKPFDVRGLASAIRAHARPEGQPSADAAALAPAPLPDFMGRAATPSGGNAPSATAATTRALLLDGQGGYALTIVGNGLPEPMASAGWTTEQAHACLSPTYTLDVMALDAPALGRLLGMDGVAPVHGDMALADLSATPRAAAADSVGFAAGCDPMARSLEVSSLGPSTLPIVHGASLPAATPDWLAGLMPRGSLH